MTDLQKNGPCCRCGRACVIAGLVLLAVVMIVAAARRPSVKSALARWLDTGGPAPAKADFAYVLGGGMATRPAAAAALYRQGRVGRILVSHIASAEVARRGELPEFHELTTRILVALGVPPEKITVIGKNCATTYDEAAALADYLADKPEAKVVLVTEFFHARRSQWTAERVLGAARQVSVFSAPGDGFAADSWWRDPRGVAAVLNEFSRLTFYLFRYGHAALWLAVCLSAGIIWFYLLRRRAASACGAAASVQNISAQNASA